MLEWRLIRNDVVIAEGCAEDTAAWWQIAFMSIQLTPDKRDYPVIETRRKGDEQWIESRAVDT